MIDLTEYGFTIEARAPATETSENYSDRDVMMIAKKDAALEVFGIKGGKIEGHLTYTSYEYDGNCGWMCSFPMHKTDENLNLTGFINIGFYEFDEMLEDVDAAEVKPNSHVRVAMEAGHTTCDINPTNCTQHNAPTFKVQSVVKAKDVGNWLRQHYPAFEKALMTHALFHKENGYRQDD